MRPDNSKSVLTIAKHSSIDLNVLSTALCQKSNRALVRQEFLKISQDTSTLFKALANKTPGKLPINLPETERFRIVSDFIGMFLAVRLAELGGDIETAPGEPVIIRLNGQEFRPFETLSMLRENKISPEEWQTACQRTGLTNPTHQTTPISA